MNLVVLNEADIDRVRHEQIDQSRRFFRVLVEKFSYISRQINFQLFRLF